MPQKSLGGHRQVSAGQTQDTECNGIDPRGREGMRASAKGQCPWTRRSCPAPTFCGLPVH